jgi:DNA-binding NtrC family response regulator
MSRSSLQTFSTPPMRAPQQMPKETESMRGRVLVVDDFRQARESVADVLRAVGHHVECLASATEALAKIEKDCFDVIVTDLQMPGMSGLEFIRHLENRPHGAQILMVTAHATVASAVEAMRRGAFDYIEKPFNVDQLEQLVGRALEHGRMLDAAARLPSNLGDAAVMIGSSQTMKDLRSRILQVARTPETVLILGESGTGKELVARAIHAASNRSESPLVSLNCPVLSAHLMESELFGHERGAFTGADGPRTGRFELANGGTILLDEISEIELSLQAKLLRVLQEKSFERVGSSSTIHVDVRVLATSNRDLRTEIAEGKFREDLYYRLAVVPMQVPSLRSRRDDIPELVAHFLYRSAQRLSRDPCDLEPAAIDLLCDYDWPGNVRELENIVARASVLNLGGPVRADELRTWISSDGSTCSSHGHNANGSTHEYAPHISVLAGQGGANEFSLEAMERKLIEATLERFEGHRAKTAEALGIGLRTLSGKLKQYGYAPRARNFAASTEEHKQSIGSFCRSNAQNLPVEQITTQTT